MTGHAVYHPRPHKWCLLLIVVCRPHQFKASSQEAPLGTSIKGLPFLTSVCQLENNSCLSKQ